MILNRKYDKDDNNNGNEDKVDIGMDNRDYDKDICIGSKWEEEKIETGKKERVGEVIEMDTNMRQGEKSEEKREVDEMEKVGKGYTMKKNRREMKVLGWKIEWCLFQTKWPI